MNNLIVNLNYEISQLNQSIKKNKEDIDKNKLQIGKLLFDIDKQKEVQKVLEENYITIEKSLGIKKALSNTLEYKSPVSNALFLLRCLDEGEEERIFTYRKGNQIWW